MKNIKAKILSLFSEEPYIRNAEIIGVVFTIIILIIMFLQEIQ